MPVLIASFPHFARKRGLTPEQMSATIARYKTFQTDDIQILESERTLFDWCSKQTYIALGNMMTGAALDWHLILAQLKDLVTLK